MSEALRIRKERITKFLNWADAQKELTIYQIREWFFDNYALSEISIDKTIKQLRAYGYLRLSGGYFYVFPKNRLL